MIRAVVWKELREQGLIAAMLAVLGGGLMIAAATFADPPQPGASPTDLIASLGLGRLLTLMLIVTAGLVCGGALFAAEKEAGTMGFLEALPTTRWGLWRAKLVAGVVLVAMEVGLLMATAYFLELATGQFLARLIIYAMMAFAWGMFGSTLARTTLGSVGVAIPAATLATFLLLLPITLFLSGRGVGMPRPLGWLIFEVLMVVTPLLLSAWRFTALDRLRASAAVEQLSPTQTPVSSGSRGSAGWGIKAIIWLTLRQLRLTGGVLSAFALAFGSALLLPELGALFVWPVLALAAGVLAGVTAFGDEQSHGTALYWGEHRLPIGRAWWVKIALHLGLLAWLLVLVALPCLIRSQFEPNTRAIHGQTTFSAIFRSRVFDELGSQAWKYLLVPAVYGFAFGHLCGLLFRKLVVACGVAMMLGGVAAALWGPSLLAGGVRHWQLWLPAVAVLLTGRLLMRFWSADRATHRAPLLRLAVGMTAVAVAFAVGLVYRVVQIPDEASGEEDLAFVASLPGYDENVGGREFRMAAERFARAATTIQEGARQPEGLRRQRIDERLEAGVRFGWPKDDPEMDRWLDRMYAPPPNAEDKPWQVQAAEAATRPIGVYDPPQLVNTTALTAGALENARKMSHALLGRGLQQQALGDPTAFVPAFRTVMVLARTLRNGGGVMALETGIEVERIAIQAADRWLERLPQSHANQTLSLARTAAELDDATPFEIRPYILADRFVIRGLMQAPSQWLSLVLTPPGRPAEQGAAEADLITVAWTVPWERERTRRLVGYAPDSLRPDTRGLLAGRPGAPLLQARLRLGPDLADRENYVRVIRRAIILKAAIRTFTIERGGPPGSQKELVSCGYLARLPEDPYTEGNPFGYRVSAGEELRGPARAAPLGRSEEPSSLAINPGQVLVWSVGVDRADQGGKVLPGGPRAEDIVFLVPPPALPLPWEKGY